MEEVKEEYQEETTMGRKQIRSPEEQCLWNIQSWLRAVGAPNTLKLSKACVDRCFFHDTGGEFTKWLRREAETGYGRFDNLGWSYREQVPTTSAEVTIHNGWVSMHDVWTVEIDFDYYNPYYGVLYALLHAAECLKNKWPWKKSKTDPFRIAKGLKKRGINV